MGLIRLQFTPPPQKRTFAGGEPHRRGSGRTGSGNLERTDPSFVEKPVMSKDKRGFPTPYPHLQRHRHRAIDDTIEVRNEIAMVTNHHQPLFHFSWIGNYRQTRPPLLRLPALPCVSGVATLGPGARLAVRFRSCVFLFWATMQR